MKWDDAPLPDSEQWRWLAGIEAALIVGQVPYNLRPSTRKRLVDIVADAYDAGHDAGYSDATDGEAMA